MPCSASTLAILLIVQTFQAPTANYNANSRWVIQERSGEIEYYCEFNPGMPELRQAVRNVSLELESLTGLRPTQDAIQIVVFSSQQNYVRYLSPKIPEARYRKALFYKNGDVFQIYAYRSRSLVTDIRHELTHAILHQNLRFVPLWIDEGLAELLEETASQRDSSTRLSSVRWKSRMGWSPSLDRLESLNEASEMDEDDYRDSWAWIHYLTQGSDSNRQILREYLAVIARGEAPGDFSAFLADRNANAENMINSYFRKFRFSLSSAKD